MDEQLLAARRGRRMRHGERDAEQGIGPQAALVRRPVERDQPGVEARLVVEVDPRDLRGDHAGSRSRRPRGPRGRHSAGSRRRAARSPRAGPCSPPRGRSPARRRRRTPSPRPRRSAARASRAPAAPSVPSVWPCRLSLHLANEQPDEALPTTTAHPGGPGGRTIARGPGPARRDTRPGSCRRPAPGSRPPCAGWPDGSARRLPPAREPGARDRHPRIHRVSPRYRGLSPSSAAMTRISLSTR